jgi:hypothetical protein
VHGRLLETDLRGAGQVLFALGERIGAPARRAEGGDQAVGIEAADDNPAG